MCMLETIVSFLILSCISKETYLFYLDWFLYIFCKSCFEMYIYVVLLFFFYIKSENNFVISDRERGHYYLVHYKVLQDDRY